MGRTGDASRKVPWDQRFTEHLARQSREAANAPARPRNPPFGQQGKSRYYWLSWVAFSAGALILLTAHAGWLDALGATLYTFGFLASLAARKDARASGLRRETEG
jgi:hypothetical protein